MFDANTGEMTSSFGWSHPLESQITFHDEFITLLGESFLGDMLENDENEYQFVLLSTDILESPSSHFSLVVKFAIFKYELTGKTESGKECVDWIQVIAICNYKDATQEVVVNKVQSYSKSEKESFEESVLFEGSREKWDHWTSCFFYEVMDSFEESKTKTIEVRGFFLETDEQGRISSGAQTIVVFTWKSYPYYLSKMEKGVVLL